MKFFKIIFLTFLTAVVVYSCSKNVLDDRPLGQLDASAIKNKAGIDALLVGAYSLLDGVGSPNAAQIYEASGSNWLFGTVCGSEAHKGSESDDQPDMQSIERFTTTANNEFMGSKWGTVYDGAQRCNDVLRIMRQVPGLTDVDTIEWRAEALFLRAHYHMEAKMMWNYVPFVDESITYTNDNYRMRNETDIWPFIEQDLKYAVTKLPLAQEEIGRANHYTALALLAKAYLFQHKFDSAKTALDEIISSGVYSLGKFEDNFNPQYQNGPESVFAYQSSVNDGAQGGNGNVGDVLNYPYGTGPVGCCGFFLPSQYLVNHYKTDPATGLPDLDNFNQVDVKSDFGLLSSDPFTPYTGTLDPRLDWTVGRRGLPYLDWGLNPGKDWQREQGTGGSPYTPIKNLISKSQIATYSDASFWTPGGSNANNINLIRYSEVLLWAAEAETEVGTLQKATDYVNQVRSRMLDSSGWVHTYIDPSKPELGFTNTPAANYKIGLYPVFISQDYARKAVRYESMLELAMEGHRFFDLVRWGIAQTEINPYLAKEKNITGYLSGAVYDSTRDNYFPIPQSEIDKSGHLLKQNQGY